MIGAAYRAWPSAAATRARTGARPAVLDRGALVGRVAAPGRRLGAGAGQPGAVLPASVVKGPRPRAGARRGSVAAWVRMAITAAAPVVSAGGGPPAGSSHRFAGPARCRPRRRPAER